MKLAVSVVVVLLLTVCAVNAKEVRIDYHGLAQRWKAEVTPQKGMEDLISKFVSGDESGPRPDLLVIACQMCASGGDLSRSLALCERAVAGWPNLDGPHYEKARIMYSLAIYDMVKRNLVKIKLKPINQIPPASLKSGYVLYEAREILRTNQKLYIARLKRLGVTDNQRMQMQFGLLILNLDKTTSSEEDKVSLIKDLKQRYGSPTKMTVIEFHPDAASKAFLGEIADEIKKDKSCKKMSAPKGMIVIDTAEMDDLLARINEIRG